MGRMKDLMIEKWNERDIHFKIQFLCPTCGHPAVAMTDNPANDENYLEEVTCLNREANHAWNVEITRTRNGYSAVIDGEEDTEVILEVEEETDDFQEFDDWDEPPPEPGAYGIFERSLQDWRNHVSKLGSTAGDSSLNRMFFSNLFSILEAYLSDTIIGVALTDVGLQRKLLSLPKLKDQLVSLETVLDKPDIVRDSVRDTLQAMSFHNLEMVQQVCKNAFGISILPNDQVERALVMKSVSKRHDCVHRNGFNKDGVEHTDITFEYLVRLSTIFGGMVGRLETALSAALAEKYFEEVGIPPN